MNFPPTSDPRLRIVSDTHFFHNNIVRYQGRDAQIFKLTGREIDHNDYMVERWNAVVAPDDPVLHLGDLYYWRKGGPERFAAEIAPKLNGEKWLILGNHDKEQYAAYEAAGFKVVPSFSATIRGIPVAFDHYPYTPGKTTPIARIHGHIHNNGYPTTDNWRDGSLESREGHFNASVEAIEYAPILLTEILERMVEAA